MANNLIAFTPRAELDAAENLANFIKMCRRELTVFGKSLDFESNTWDVTSAVELKGQANKRIRALFSIAGFEMESPIVAMPEPFLSFAKAYFRYMHSMRPTKSIGSRLAALRMLEKSLSSLNETANPLLADAYAFSQAAIFATEQFSPAVSYRVAQQLEMLARFMAKNELVPLVGTWKNPVRRPKGNDQVGAQHDVERHKKMPSNVLMRACAEAYTRASEPNDVLVTSVVAILCCAPNRINEVVLLPSNCEVNQTWGKDQQELYGIRWWPAKGAEPMVKWVLPQMVPVAREAIGRIRRITESARSVAAWYEEHPGSVYLGASLEHLRSKEKLTFEEVDRILFSRGNRPASPRAAKVWCTTNKVPLQEQLNGSALVRFSDLNSAVISKLPQTFPYVSRELGLKYSEALFTCRLNELHATRPPSQCLIEALTGDKVNERLGTGSAYGKQSVFERLNVGRNDGSPLKITTHMFRHYLNTLAHRVNLSDEDIALWSGRKDIEQNAAYDHTTSEERVEMLREILPQSSNLPTVIKQFVAIPRDKFGRLLTRTAHTTDLGYCIHDYAMAPCQLHRDCINCEEQICVKRDDEKSACLQAKLSEAELLLTRAKHATKEGYAGADR